MSQTHPSIAEVAALVGNPARANILTALLDGRALTAGELAYAAGVSAQTTSGHLSQLEAAHLLAQEKQGRHRYFRLASPLVGRMLEGLMAVAADGPPRYRPRWRGDEALKELRTCYDHLAGRLAVALTERLAAKGHLVLEPDGGLVTPSGRAFFSGFGLDMAAIAQGRRAFCRPCLDWSERRPHLAGAIGAALAGRCFEAGWIAKQRDSRALTLTATGRDGFRDIFGLET